MANPQLEDGFTPIAHEILEALMQVNLNSYQSRLLFAIWRKTYGWGKKKDWISVSQLSEMTGIRMSHVSRTKAQLVQLKIVTQIGNKIGFNKNYEEWLPFQDKKLPNQVQKLPNQGNTIDTKQEILNNNKENINIKESNVKEFYKKYRTKLIENKSIN